MSEEQQDRTVTLVVEVEAPSDDDSQEDFEDRWLEEVTEALNEGGVPCVIHKKADYNKVEQGD